MRKSLSVILFFLLAISFVACKKSDSQFVAPETLQIGAYIRLDSTINTKLNYSTLATDKISIVVRGVGETIDKIITYASTNNSVDKSTWKKIVETPVVNADNKATITFTGAQLGTALGIAPSAFAPGTTYTIYNEILTKSGKTYSIINTASSFEPEAAYAMALRFNVSIVCPFNSVGFVGDFAIVKDEWDDFSIGDIVKVTAATATSITMLVYPAPGVGTNRQPVTVNINPDNGTATVARQAYGNYGATSYSVETSGSSNFVFACTGTITLLLKHTATASGANQGSYRLILKKV